MAYEVLFVCTGNVCRSPAAERLLQRHLDLSVGGIAGLSGVAVSSAGTGALVGEPISPPMAAPARGGRGERRGVRRSAALRRTCIRAADLVITMTGDHRRQTVAMVPAAVQRTFVLGELAHMLSHVEVPDVTEITGPSASTAERLRAVVQIAQRNRTPGVDPDEDVVDPYGRSKSVYLESFRQIRAALESVARLAVPSAGQT